MDSYEEHTDRENNPPDSSTDSSSATCRVTHVQVITDSYDSEVNKEKEWCVTDYHKEKWWTICFFFRLDITTNRECKEIGHYSKYTLDKIPITEYSSIRKKRIHHPPHEEQYSLQNKKNYRKIQL